MKFEEWMISYYAGSCTGLACVSRSDHSLPEEPQLNGTFGRLPITFRPIEPSHPIVHIYEYIRGYVLKACRSIDWTMIGVRRVGWKPRNTENPVVLLVVARAQRDDFPDKATDCVRKLSSLLTGSGLPDVQVHIACAGAKATQEEDNCVNLENCRDSLFSKTPRSGSSIGPRGGTVCGSLGPYVKVTTGDGQTYHAAIVSHHVAFDHCSKFDPSFDAAVVLESPAPDDFKTIVTWAQEQASNAKSTTDEYRDKLQAIEIEEGPDSACCERFRESIREGDKLYNYNKSTLEQAEKIKQNTAFGHVVASSGLETFLSTMPLSDWAILRLEPGRCGSALSTLLPFEKFYGSELERLLTRLQPSMLDSVKRSKLSPPDDLCIATQELLVPEDDNMPMAILYGRTSGWSLGIVNALKDDVKIRYSCGATVCGCLLPVLDFKKTYFSRGGDSGAVIYNEECRVIGTLVRGRDDIRTTYVAPIAHTLNDIKTELRWMGEDVKTVKVI